MFGDDGGEAELCGLKSREAEGFGVGGHAVGVCHGEEVVDFLAIEETGEVEVFPDTEADRFCDHAVELFSGSGESEADIGVLLEDLAGDFKKVIGAFLCGDAAKEDDELFRERFGGSEGRNGGDAVVDDDGFLR